MSGTLRLLVLALAILIFEPSLAHTWNEQFALIGADGNYTGPLGYPRAYVSRTEPTFTGYNNLHLLPPLESGRTRINNKDLLCMRPQREPKQSPGYPRLQVAPGSHVAMKYLENGHVTLPDLLPGKPPKGGTTFVYGTHHPLKGEKIATVLQWTRDGKGGDARGRLLAANNFDDGRCHQLNDSPISIARQQTDPDSYPDQPGSVAEQWCETDVTLPTDLTVGAPLAIYWVWQWPTAPGTPGLPAGKDEYYTTCSDFDVVAQEPSGPVSNTLVQQDPQPAAVSDYKSRPAITQVPNLTLEPIGPHPTAAEKALAAASESALSLTVPPAPAPPVVTGPGSAAYPSAFSMSLPLSAPSLPTAAPAPAAAIPTPAPAPLASEALPSPPPTTLPITSQQPLQTAFAAATNGPSGTVLTALVTVVGTLAPGQSMLIVQGTHVVTFTNPAAAAAAATTTPVVKRGVMSGKRGKRGKRGSV